MKKNLIALLVALFLTPAIMNAQFHLSLGPVAGFNFNIHSSSDINKTPVGLGLVFGAQCDMAFSKSFGLVTNVLFFDGRYGGYSDTQNGVNYDVGTSIGYFTIEPMAKFTLPSSGIHFLVGPMIGFNIQSSMDISYSYQGQSGNQTSTLRDMNILFGLKGGAGWDMQLSKLMTLTPQVFISYDLTQLQKDSNWNVFTIQAACALKFHLL